MYRLSKSWIDRKLSRKEREQLIDLLLERTNEPSGEQIQGALHELFPARQDIPTIKSCIEWKNKTWAFERHLRQLAEDDELAKIISEKSQDISEANKGMTDAYVFQNLRLLREGRADEVDPNILEWILAASRLAKRTESDKRTAADLKKTEAQLAKLELELSKLREEKQEREKSKNEFLKDIKKKGLTPETLSDIEEKIKML